MTRWHADVNAAALLAGAEVTVISHHHVVRVITSDTLLIQGPDGQRQTAMVLERTAGRIRLALEDGRMVQLHLLVDESLQPLDPSVAFSQQTWITH